MLRAIRFKGNPIIRPHMDSRMGENINGPSLIRVPDWLPSPLGRYYLYFAHHGGTYIRLAYADRLEGPWRTYEPGTLQLAESLFVGHIASPDVHVDEVRRLIRMYYHGGLPEGGQMTRVALSEDGIHFTPLPEVLGNGYFRLFQWRRWHYAIARSGRCYRSRDGLTAFEEGPPLPNRNMRHCAVTVDGDVLSVFYSNIGDCPERILRVTIRLAPDWTGWKESEPEIILEPEMEYEGADLPLRPSVSGRALHRVREVRDPAIYREDGRTYLLYSVAGERGIAIAELVKE